MAHGDITHVEIPVGDFARSTDFYGTLFGWQIAEAPGFEGYPMWEAPSHQYGGALTERGEGFTQPRAYVTVDSIDDTVAAAARHGGRVITGKSEITPTSWWAAIEDPDGNVLGLFEGTM